MKVRCHRGALVDAMLTFETVADSYDALTAYFRTHYDAAVHTFRVEPYAPDGDARIGWDSVYIVTAIWPDGNRAPVGWTDRLVKQVGISYTALRQDALMALKHCTPNEIAFYLYDHPAERAVVELILEEEDAKGA